METGTVLPLNPLNTDILRQHPVIPNAEVGQSDQCYFHHILNVSARPRVGLFPFCCEANGYVFKRSLRLHIKGAFHRDEKGLELAILLDASLQVFTLILLIIHLEALLQILVLVGEGVRVHDTHVVNTIRPSLSEVTGQKISLILQRLVFHRQIVVKLPISMVLYLPHCATWMDEGVVVHVRGGKMFA